MRAQIVLSALARALSYGVSFVSVPLLIKTLGKQDYGVWVTLTSLIAWIVMFDFGVGNSLKNKITKYSALNEQHKIHEDILGIFKFFVFLSVALLFSFFSLVYFLDILSQQLIYACILYIPIIIFFPMSMGISILQGMRKVGLHAILAILPQALFLVYLLIVLYFKISLNLFWVSCAFVSINSLSSLLVLHVALEKVKLPWHSFLNWGAIRIPIEHIATSLSFLLLQITSLVLFSLGNSILYGSLGAGSVAKYDVVNKLFLSAMGLYNILIGVAWPEIVHRKVLDDISGLYKILYGLIGCGIVFSLLVFIGIQYVPFFINTWTGGQIKVELEELYYFGFLTSIQAVAYSGAVFLNAFEKILPQILLGILSIIGMLPLCHYFIGHGYDITAIPLASGILIIPATVVCFVYANILIRGLRFKKINLECAV